MRLELLFEELRGLAKLNPVTHLGILSRKKVALVKTSAHLSIRKPQDFLEGAPRLPVLLSKRHAPIVHAAKRRASTNVVCLEIRRRPCNGSHKQDGVKVDI